MDTNKTQSKEELLKAVADVLEEALAEYETLTKFDAVEAEDPSKAPVAAAPEAKEESPEAKEEVMDEEKKDEDEEEKKKKEDEKDEDEETLKSEYAALTEKMKARGLLKTEEAPKAEAAPAPKAELAKTEEAPKAEDKTEELRKSFDDRFSALAKAVESLTASVQQIASQPAAPRKGVAGYAPLRKSEGSEESLNKAEVLEKLLELKKSNHRGVDSTLIYRVETGKTSSADIERIKGLLA
jgi:hypothetical protein